MRYRVRIAIREQLAFLVTFAVLLALAILSVPTWIYVNNFVVGVEEDSLSLAASLKATRIASEITLVQTMIETISTRILIQQSLETFYQGNTSASNWVNTEADMQSALGSGSGNLYQAKIFSRNSTGPSYGLFNVTGLTTPQILLPYENSAGAPVYLGDEDGGFPPSLYPNITYVDTGAASATDPNTNVYAAYAFSDVRLSENAGLLLGPLVINDTFALMSLTIPMRSNAGGTFILGYMTVVASASTIVDVVSSREGMGESGVLLIIGPTAGSNRFNASNPASNATYVPPDLSTFENISVHFVLPPQPAAGGTNRHETAASESGDFGASFPLKDYPAALWEFSKQIAEVNNASSDLWTHNEEGTAVSVGYARTQNELVNWTVVVEQARWEATAPINTLRKILLGCTFGTAGLVLLLIIPCAHWSVLPIRRLKAATERSVAPPGYHDELDLFEGYDANGNYSGSTSKRSAKGFIAWISREIRRRRRRFASSHTDTDPNRRVFKIPGKVEVRKVLVTDELTELTEVFNEMTSELLKQYNSLDSRVQERTRELEISKKAAEAANESKTLFIANISHELKTPLNGIMGMCAVCMEEDDVVRIKQSLKTLYKSGDLLLHLLEDLLSFSKNQIGQQVSLEEREFRLGDIRSQILSIFDKQVREGRITLTADFVGPDFTDLTGSPERQSLDRRLPAVGPPGIGRLKDMCLWGDQHRILQVMINLVSNSLKFTPAGGKVMVRIRCVGEVETSDESRASSFSRTSSRPGRSRHRLGSGSQHSASSKGGTSNAQHQVQRGTALAINPTEVRTIAHTSSVERPVTPPPPNAKTYMFEFEVEDTGPGIPEHMHHRVFEPFVQGDLGLSRKFGGTGLGLSICSQLATLMGGNVSLRSTLGVGTTFIVQIPLKYTKDKPSSTASSSLRGSRPPSVTSDVLIDSRRESVGDTPAHTETANPAPTTTLDKQPRLVGLSQPFFATAKNNNPPQTEAEKMAVLEKAMEKKGGEGKLRVLVADDNNTNIEVVSRMLKLESVVDVTIAKDGQEAFELVKANFERNERFDVIFMDIQMPNLDGLQSTRLIRQMGYKAPIVALTAFSDASNVKDCMDSGMNEFLAKPIRRPALKQVLQKFATIPEEPETASVMTRKTTPDESPPTTTGNKEKKDQGPVVSATELLEKPYPNGLASPGKS
ncbi:hypothetical protein M406DRAFT_93599 [Cryphonectria parasitica EP155]|uniref:histidine kinase n=1 Tax=Cryphonectria parasitica (strain ATCC 38755 / EP155) TaxID=660469 RepID=A0A9P4XTX0_CRYP1|nr:uncharacterized protein M406DRAFT_93599 [Cryphonectria parasitica EP155]KAF3760766.1 hypothetical protein M406DRAFT_93599 [Cryphonectria parasitica EP155]